MAVLNVCSAPTRANRPLLISAGRHAVGPYEPAPQMTLVGETKPGGDFHGLHPRSKHLATSDEAQLDQPGVGRQSVGRLERAGQSKTVGAAGFGQGVQVDVLFVVSHQVIARLSGNHWRAGYGGGLRSAIHVNRQPFQQHIQGRVAHDAHVLFMQRIEREQRGPSQLGIVVEHAADARQPSGATGQRQAIKGPFEPRRLQVQHAVGEPVGAWRVTVVDVARFKHEDLAGRTVVPHPTAVETLHALLGESDQVGFVPVRIIGMRVPREMRVQGFDAGVPVEGKVDPFAHGVNTVVGCGQ